MDAQTLNDQTIQQAIAVLKNGGVVVFPTETAYGLAADAANTESVDRVSLIKGRTEDKSLPLIAADTAMVEVIAGIPRGLRSLADRYWPGPLTLVLPVMGDQLAASVIRQGTIAIRVSSHPVAQALARGLGRPIVSTSANRSGEPTCYSLECVKKQFEHQPIKPDYYLDAGVLLPEPTSTIVGLDDYGIPEVLRQGSIEI
ncbi:threonylcarbamoyl-AMP synthase [Candidatus Uhrbacteria bacterium]|nr:threonylcarbamoyl-AMP synthase [Candidatus Uhrbacteria bacterium]